MRSQNWEQSGDADAPDLPDTCGRPDGPAAPSDRSWQPWSGPLHGPSNQICPSQSARIRTTANQHLPDLEIERRFMIVGEY